jgi:hypothetical protein
MEALGFNVRVVFSCHYRDQTKADIYQASSGFLEGIVRGYKSGLLTQGAYHNLTQCENLEGESDVPCSLSPPLTIYPFARLCKYDIRADE